MVQRTAMDVANFYIDLIRSIPDNTIDNLKLNKILYYAQGWSLVRLGHPLFNDKIEAWEYGPVIPRVYHCYKACGKMPIEEPEEVYDESNFTTEEVELLIDVYRYYGRYTGWALKEMTHVQGSPWASVFKKNQNQIITIDLMKSYFESENEMLPSFDVEHLNIPIITEVPASWDSVEDEVYG